MRSAPGLRLLRLANPVVLRVLDSRAHGALSAQLLVLTYHGHRSGRVYRIPLRYAEVPGGPVVAIAVEPTGKEWWRSFVAPHPATLTVRGERHSVVGALAQGDERRRALDAYAARFRTARGLAAAAAVVAFEPRHG